VHLIKQRSIFLRQVCGSLFYATLHAEGVITKRKYSTKLKRRTVAAFATNPSKAES